MAATSSKNNRGLTSAPPAAPGKAVTPPPPVANERVSQRNKAPAAAPVPPAAGELTRKRDAVVPTRTIRPVDDEKPRGKSKITVRVPDDEPDESEDEDDDAPAVKKVKRTPMEKTKARIEEEEIFEDDESEEEDEPDESDDDADDDADDVEDEIDDDESEESEEDDDDQPDDDDESEDDDDDDDDDEDEKPRRARTVSSDSPPSTSKENADQFAVALHDLINRYGGNRPLGRKFNELSRAALNQAVMVRATDQAKALKRSLQKAIDAGQIDLLEIGAEIQAEQDEKRKAWIESNKGGIEWLNDIREAGLSKLIALGDQIVALGGTIKKAPAAATATNGKPGRKSKGESSNGADKPVKSRSKNSWAERIPMIVEFLNQDEINITDFVIVDRAANGYEGTFNALRGDPKTGTWEIVEYNGKKGGYKWEGTGEYWDKSPIDYVAHNAGKRPPYSVEQMYMVLMIDADGNVVEIHDVNGGAKGVGGSIFALVNLACKPEKPLTPFPTGL